MTPDGATSPFVADNPSQIAAQNMSLYEMCKHAAVVKDPRELVSLVSHPDVEVRRVLAQRTDLSNVLNRRLAHDPDWRVRQQLVLWHKRLPVDVFETLADDPSWIVRKTLPGNKHCPPSVIEELSTDRSPWVRQAAVRSPNITDRTIQQLASDQSKPVQQAFRQRLHHDRLRLRFLAAINHSELQEPL